MFQDKKEFLTFLETQKKHSMKLSLERVALACERLGNPQLTYKTIHVAGTNGKGSTVNYLCNLLRAHGFKVGMYISPYIVTFNERIQINGDYISDEDLVVIANEIFPVIQDVEQDLNDEMTEFEIITLIAYVYYQKLKVDYAVFEVGLGGRYDATNLIKPLVAGITNISFDHIGILGDTIAKIAYEKVGIAKAGMRLYTTEHKQEALDVFQAVTAETNTELVIVPEDMVEDIKLQDEGISFIYQPKQMEITLPMLGKHQVQNALLALQMYEYILEQAHIPFDGALVEKALSQAKWAGRLEIISKRPLVLIDGSHNEAGVETLIQTMDYYRTKGYEIITIFAALKDKDTRVMLQHLQSMSKQLILTTFDYYRASSTDLLLSQSNGQNIVCEADFKQAITNAITSLEKRQLLLITGSLYFISQVKHYLNSFKIVS